MEQFILLRSGGPPRVRGGPAFVRPGAMDERCGPKVVTDDIHDLATPGRNYSSLIICHSVCSR